jgi:hypothetical protein
MLSVDQMVIWLTSQKEGVYYMQEAIQGRLLAKPSNPAQESMGIGE